MAMPQRDDTIETIKQLYAKYGLTKPEQKFIESMIKPIRRIKKRSIQNGRRYECKRKHKVTFGKTF